MARTLKPRPPGRLAMLSPAQHGQLIEWLRENRTYKQIVVLMREELGVTTNPHALGDFYHHHAAEILGPMPAPTPAATGVSVTITCQRPGEIKLSVHPLRPDEVIGADDGTADLRASGVEVIGICQREGEIKLAVFPVAAPSLPT